MSPAQHHKPTNHGHYVPTPVRGGGGGHDNTSYISQISGGPDLSYTNIVTPNPTRTKKRGGRKQNVRQVSKQQLLMMADLMSPNPNPFHELSSPAPSDKNAKYLTQKPTDISFVMPPTPGLQTIRIER